MTVTAMYDKIFQSTICDMTIHIKWCDYTWQIIRPPTTDNTINDACLQVLLSDYEPDRVDSIMDRLGFVDMNDT